MVQLKIIDFFVQKQASFQVLVSGLWTTTYLTCCSSVYTSVIFMWDQNQFLCGITMTDIFFPISEVDITPPSGLEPRTFTAGIKCISFRPLGPHRPPKKTSQTDTHFKFINTASKKIQVCFDDTNIDLYNPSNPALNCHQKPITSLSLNPDTQTLSQHNSGIGNTIMFMTSPGGRCFIIRTYP